MDGFPETQGKILTNSSKFFENSSKILSKLKQNPQKLNLPEIQVTSVAAKTTKKACLTPRDYIMHDGNEQLTDSVIWKATDTQIGITSSYFLYVQ